MREHDTPLLWAMQLMSEDQACDAAALPRPWQDVTTVMSPQRHQAYALQWLGLAVAALIMYLIARLRGRRRHQPDA